MNWCGNFVPEISGKLEYLFNVIKAVVILFAWDYRSGDLLR